MDISSTDVLVWIEVRYAMNDNNLTNNFDSTIDFVSFCTEQVRTV